jgi:hypothetical protein
VRVAAPDHLRCAEDVAQHVVVEAVVGALELHDLLAARDAAGEPEGVERRLRPAVADDGLLGARHVLRDLACELHLALRHAGPEQDLLTHGLCHALRHVGMRVPEQDRAVRGVVVDVAAALEIPQVGARAAAEAELGLALAPARVHAAGDDVRSRVEQRDGRW